MPKVCPSETRRNNTEFLFPGLPVLPEDSFQRNRFDLSAFERVDAGFRLSSPQFYGLPIRLVQATKQFVDQIRLFGGLQGQGFFQNLVCRNRVAPFYALKLTLID